MSLLAVGTFALFAACPPAVAATGLAITIIVAAAYLSRQIGVVADKTDEKTSGMSFFSRLSTSDDLELSCNGPAY